MHGVSHQGKVLSETTTFGWVWPVLYLIQSDCIDILFFADEVCHQGKVAHKANFFGWVWLVEWKNERKNELKERMNSKIIEFLDGDNHQRNLASNTSTVG